MKFGKPKYGPAKWVKAEDYDQLQAELEEAKLRELHNWDYQNEDGEWVSPMQDVLKENEQLQAELEKLKKFKEAFDTLEDDMGFGYDDELLGMKVRILYEELTQNND